ncbi:glycosyltransferase family 8 protein [Cohnella nanjingensis]|uniref:Glycosyltransferase family 8 protein n=1 Tax=Cohnella nanjingensis TaxID=1387779 RepID=A0A7X0RT33_9BACL|nr:glycosyltransferase family 8 protein [Cohnella nanjingensis]MBB6671689.1 glycosyltransferase family 8 protein [Cohnella nanjingensis]
MIEIETISIVASTDNLYVQHLAVAFASLLVNLSQGFRARFFVIDGGIDEAERSRLEQTMHAFGAEVELIQVNQSAFSDLYIADGRHITQATYYRLAIPELFRDREIDRVIYLDCDLLVVDDISELWQTDMKDHPIAAVEDLGGHERLADLFMPANAKYFNSGVLLIQIREWNRLRITHDVLCFLRENRHRLIYHDQDGLNAVLHDRWLELHPRWNVQRNMFGKEASALSGRDRERVRLATRDPAVVHFTGTSKPWQFDNAHPRKRDYYRYLSMTEWRAFRPPVGPKLLLRRLIKGLLPEAVVAALSKLGFR